jgi:Tfp pilus assembly protein PilO
MTRLSKEKRDRLIVVIVGGVVLIAGIWYGVIKTRLSELELSKTRLAAAKDKLEKGKKRVEQADQVEAAMEAAVRRLRAIEDGLAPGADLSWSLLLMDKAQAGPEIEVVDVSRPQTNEVGVLPAFPYKAATFTVRGIAHYHDFGKFLADFENKFPYFRAQNLALTVTAETGSEGTTTRSGKAGLFFKVDIVAVIRPSQ